MFKIGSRYNFCIFKYKKHHSFYFSSSLKIIQISKTSDSSFEYCQYINV